MRRRVLQRTQQHVPRGGFEMSDKPSRPLTGIEWAMLLCAHPELASQCDWTLFDGNAWHCLLCKRPEFETLDLENYEPDWF